MLTIHEIVTLSDMCQVSKTQSSGQPKETVHQQAHMHHLSPSVKAAAPRHTTHTHTHTATHLLEGHLARELQPLHHHACHPEEQDVVACLQQRGGVELGQVLRGWWLGGVVG